MATTQGDKVALVTGGAQRIGAFIVRELAHRGYRVAIHANTSIDKAEADAKRLQASGRDAVAVSAELRDEVRVRNMIDQVHRQFGRLDALVNSAAVWPRMRLEQVTASQVRECFEINTLGTWICCQHAGMIMAKQESGGAIVNLGDWAIVRPYLDYGAYFPSKGAIPTLTRDFAIELAARNPRVRVNAVLPGPVLLSETLSPEERQTAVASTLVKREGRGEEIAAAVVLLLENEFITGATLPVDGGRTIYSPSAET